ncbi:MAG: NAD(P)-dependent oxidoreductase [Paludibacter sp.]
MRKILITGALGFIGRSLIDHLISSDIDLEIYGIDIKDFPEDAEYLKNLIQFQKLDIRSIEQVNAYFQKNRFDGIIHLAAISRVKVAEDDKQNCIDTNYFGTKFIIQKAAENAKTWVIFSSSREVYGEQRIMPVKESAVKTPLNIYGFYKLEGERIIEKYIQNYFILRFSNVYGNKYDIPDRVIPKFIHNALTGKELILEGGGQIIDFTHISDTVSSISKCIELLSSDIQFKEDLLILPGNENKITDLVEIIENEIGIKLKIKQNDKRNYDVEKFIGNNLKRKSILGDVEFLTLKEGITQTISLLKYSL